MIKKLSSMRIGERLKKSFSRIISIFAILSVVIIGVMIFMVMRYEKVLDFYAYPQGDIALVMNESAEVRSATRGLIGYEDEAMITELIAQHDEAVSEFERLLEEVRPTMVTEAGIASMATIDKAWAEYKEVDAKVVEIGSSTDAEMGRQAQALMSDEVAPKYQALDDALEELMSVNSTLGTKEETVKCTALCIIRNYHSHNSSRDSLFHETFRGNCKEYRESAAGIKRKIRYLCGRRHQLAASGGRVGG